MAIELVKKLENRLGYLIACDNKIASHSMKNKNTHYIEHKKDMYYYEVGFASRYTLENNENFAISYDGEVVPIDYRDFNNYESLTLQDLEDYEPHPGLHQGVYCLTLTPYVGIDEYHYFYDREDIRDYILQEELDMYKITYCWN